MVYRARDPEIRFSYSLNLAAINNVNCKTQASNQRERKIVSRIIPLDLWAIESKVIDVVKEPQ